MHFITFGSHYTFVDAAVRLCRQAQSTKMFTEITGYTADYLRKDKVFWKKHGDFIVKHRRGFGYWIWKPYIILKTLNQMKEGDILLYLDCGFEIDISEKNDLQQYIDLVKTDKIVGSDSKCIEKEWNKRDLIDFLDMDNDGYLLTTQRQSGAFFILVCEDTKRLMEEWYTLACDYHLIDDSPSVLPNYEVFKEHRHDQSVISLLTKKYNIWSDTFIDTPYIKCLRNRSGVSQLNKLHWLQWIAYFIYVSIIVSLQKMYRLFHNSSAVLP